MGSVSKPGTMEPSIVVNGVKTGPMAKEDSFMSMGTSTMDTGPMIRLTDGVFISTLMEPSMRACGRTTSSMGSEWKHGRTSLVMRETMPSEESMASVAISGTMDRSIWVIGVRIKLVALESTHGSMGASTKANGSTITWKAWEFTSGMMGVSTADSTKMIKSTVMVSTRGLTHAATKVSGTKVSSTGLVLMWFPGITRSSLVFGKMESVSNGLTRPRYKQSTTCR